MNEFVEELSNKIQELNKEIQSMQDDVDFLEALRAAGVDNWAGYEEAQAILEDWNSHNVLVDTKDTKDTN